jgi:hypothetical protein
MHFKDFHERAGKMEQQDLHAPTMYPKGNEWQSALQAARRQKG